MIIIAFIIFFILGVVVAMGVDAYYDRKKVIAQLEREKAYLNFLVLQKQIKNDRR